MKQTILFPVGQKAAAKLATKAHSVPDRQVDFIRTFRLRFWRRAGSKIAAFLAFLLISLLPLRAEDLSLTTQIRAKRVFTSPIESVGAQEPSDTESAPLLEAIQAFDSGALAGYAALEGFLSQHPRSAWEPSLRTHLAERYRESGRYTAALEHWEQAWSLTKESGDPTARRIAARALTGWLRLLGSVGRKEQLEELLGEAERRGLFATPYAPRLQASREGLSVMKGRPGESYRCGSLALSQVMKSKGADEAARRAVREQPSPDGGFRMSELLTLAESNRFDVAAVQRVEGHEIPVPSVVHWKLDHYAAVVEQTDDRYKVIDPTFDGPIWMDASTINGEASGYFLVPATSIPARWRRLTSVEAVAVRGKGYTYTAEDDWDNADDDEDDDDCDPPESNDGPEGGGEPCPEDAGMPQWRMSHPYITLWINDVPLYYRNSRNGWEKLRLSYKHRAVPRGDTVAGFGDNWECNWIGFLEKDNAQPAVIKAYLAGGGIVGFQTNGTPEYQSARRLITGPSFSISSSGGGKGDGGSSSVSSSSSVGVGRSLTPNPGPGTPIAVLPPRGGSENIYGFPVGYGAGITRYFLTNRMDRYGRQVRYGYSIVNVGGTDYIRLTSRNDKDGQPCTFAYTNTSFPRLITQVTDPYGRSAHFKYDNVGRLTNITDMAGMSSSFKYDSSGAVTNMVTPYGTNSFKYVSQAGNPGEWGRGLEITEPTGDKQLSVYHDGTGSGVTHHMQSYHWNRQQYAALTSGGKSNPMGGMNQDDFDLAPRTEWMRTGSDMFTARLVGTPLNREGPVNSETGQRSDYVSFAYPGQSGNIIGTLGRPESVSGSAQMEIPRNDWGRPTEFRYLRNGQWVSFTNAYNADGRRLEKVWGPNGEQVRGYGYHATITNLLTSVTNAVGDVIRYTHDASVRVTSITDPGGLVTTNIYYTSGTYTGFLQTSIEVGFRTNHYTWVNGNLEWHTNELGLATKRTWDSLNRLTSISYPDGTTISNVYNKLDLVSVKDRMTNWTHYGYNEVRQLVAKTNANGRVTEYQYCDCGSPSQITEWNGTNALITTFAYDMAGRMTNVIFPDGYSLSYKYDSQSRVSRVNDPSGMELQLNYTASDRLQSLYAYASDFSIGGQLQYHTYDEYGRAASVTDRNGVATTFQYDWLGRMTNRTVQDALLSLVSTETFAYSARGMTNSVDESGNTNWFVFDSAGRLVSQTNANNEVLQFAYNPSDQLLTLKDGKNQTTTWKFDQYGHLTNKLDQAGTEILRYKYDANNRLTNRWTVAKGDTYYRYDVMGNLTNVDYPSTVMDISLQYDILDRLTNVVDAVGTTRFAYTAAGLSLSEDGPWPDDTITYGYSHRRRTLLSVLQPNASPWTQGYGYDGIARLTNVVSAAGSFDCTYVSVVSDRMEQLLMPNVSGAGSTFILNQYDGLARLTDTALYSSQGAFNWHVYEYNAAHQRTKQTFANYNYIDYTYDKIGQLKTAKGWEADGTTARQHEQFGYAYDKAWNLQYRTNNALVQTFTNDNRNHLTSATRTNTLTVAGDTSLSGAEITSVTVSGTGLSSGAATVYADGKWARNGANLANGNNNYTATGQDTYGRTSQDIVNVNLPSVVNFSYDSNGNLTGDGARVFEYDYENQLTNVYVANTWRSEFKYDAFGRRRMRKEYKWTGSTWSLTNEVRYAYDGMLVVQERDANNLPLVSYTRGTDLSGTREGAGGIGGLLARTDHGQLATGNPQAHAYYHADANGNVICLVNTNGAVVGRYHYDPYGNVLAMSGPLAEVNLYRFSSKEWQPHAALYDYGYRYYDPNLQRWLNRDPLGDIGSLPLMTGDIAAGSVSNDDREMTSDEFRNAWAGINRNLYGAMGNNPVNRLDPSGLASICTPAGAEALVISLGEAEAAEVIGAAAARAAAQRIAARAALEAKKAADAARKAAEAAKEIKRVRDAENAINKAKDIQRAQEKVRKGQNAGKSIDRTTKSEQNMKKQLRDIANDPKSCPP